MALSIGGGDLTRIKAVLNATEINDEPTTLDAMAKAVLNEAWDIYESKAKWGVAAQLYRQADGGYARMMDDGGVARVILTPYGTERSARTAGESLALSLTSKEEWRWWPIPMFHGTPAKWHAGRKLRASEALIRHSDDPCDKIVEMVPGVWVSTCVNDRGHQGLCFAGPRREVLENG